MQRYSAASSAIASVGYDAGTETLEVEFQTSAVYQYYNVPQHMCDELLKASSVGQFFNLYIKNAYAYSRVG